MRFSLATTSCAIALALLAGCASSQNAATMPISGINGTHAGGGIPAGFHGKISPMQLLEMQASGKLPGPAPRKRLAEMLKYFKSHPHRQAVRRSGGSIGVWATDEEYSYLVGLNKNAKKAVLAVDTEDNGGYYPVTVKVDQNQNAWVANEYNDSFEGGVVQEYSSSGTLENSYDWYPSCPGTVFFCEGYGFDSAENSSNVFAGVAEFEYENDSTFDYGSGIVKMTNGDPSGGSTFYTFSDDAQSLNCTYGECDEVYYMDVDNSGNVWFTFLNEADYNGGLGELTSGGTYNIIFPGGTYGFPGGVNVSNGGTVLNVTDQDTRDTYQYHLPLTSSSTPFNTIGPSPTNIEGLGDPGSGGWNAADTKWIEGDFEGWLDACTISKCKARANINFPDGASSAAYTPSDK